ncbi:MAG TPA: hypothetical protein VNJ70_10675 [Thermoanaerobaculia bacterium]|nr:hypothetical protein [Thermoanaerobaculia bacterium]
MKDKPPGTRISTDHLDELPYVRLVPTDDRTVPLIGLFQAETEDWHLYLPHGHNELIRIVGGDMLNGSYLGKVPADRQTDIQFPLGTLVMQRLSFRDVIGALGPLENDIHRCAQILRKYHLFWEQRAAGNSFSSLLVESEVEYLLLLLRSYYDALQNVVRAIARHPLAGHEPTTRLATHELPGKFSEVLKGQRGADEPLSLAQRYGMNDALVEWYGIEAPFFRILKDLRDGIAHYGRRPSIIFETDWGFAIDPSERPWSRFNEWEDQRFKKDRLGSLRRLVACFILHALGATSRLADALGRLVELPPVLHEDLRLFVRSPFGRYLVDLETMADSPWEGRGDESSTTG